MTTDWIWVVAFCISMLIGGLIGQAARGRAGEGALLGILGPLGWLLIVAFADHRARCPECRGVVPAGARRCMHCNTDLPETAAAPATAGLTDIIFQVPVECPACSKEFHTQEENLPKGIQCPHCGLGFVPRPSLKH